MSYSDLTIIRQKIDALSIIFNAPLWPRRESLSEIAVLLFDRMVIDAKSYALAIAEDNARHALAIISSWTPLLNNLMDNERVAKNNPNISLINVYCYYVKQYADFNMIQRRVK